MGFQKIFLFSFLLIGLIFGQDCEHTNCQSCVADQNCGWCGAVQKCFPGNVNQPDLPQRCNGGSWQFESCFDCSHLKDCRSCLAFSSSCFWCKSRDEFEPSSCQSYSTTETHNCTKGTPQYFSCDCGIYSTCSSCTFESRGSCLWVKQNQTCVTRKEAPPPTSVLEGECSCTDNTACYSCEAADGCKFCASGYCEEERNQCPEPGHVTCNAYCGTATGCESCNERPGCGWCSTQGTCVDISSSSCLTTHSCPVCERENTCSGCSSKPHCRWCKNDGVCRAKDSDSTCISGFSCDNYCETFKNCDQCSAKPGCGWCPSLSKCVSVPGDSDCTVTLSCPASDTCSLNPDCTSCLNTKECVWCKKEGFCRRGGSNGTNCLASVSCDLYCDSFGSCDVCNAKPGCGWCSSQMKCVPLVNRGCPVAVSCPKPQQGKSKGFDGGSFVGGMFLVIGLAILGGGGYFIYRWKFASKSQYSELH